MPNISISVWQWRKSLEWLISSSSIQNFTQAGIQLDKCIFAEMSMDITDVKKTTFGMLLPDEAAQGLIELASKPAAAGGLADSGPQPAGNPQIDMLLDTAIPVSIELGRTEMPFEEILELRPGSIIELDRMAGEPVDLGVKATVLLESPLLLDESPFRLVLRFVFADLQAAFEPVDSRVVPPAGRVRRGDHQLQAQARRGPAQGGDPQVIALQQTLQAQQKQFSDQMQQVQQLLSALQQRGLISVTSDGQIFINQ